MRGQSDLVDVLRLFAAENPGMQRALLDAVAEIERLKNALTVSDRKLGCQIGDASCAPEHWRIIGPRLWRRDLPENCMAHVTTLNDGRWIWFFYDENDVCTKGGDLYKAWSTAYESMLDFDFKYVSGEI